MCRIFLKKYQEYSKARNLREEIFKMTQKEEEILEDYLERFLYNLQQYKKNKLDTNTIRTIFLRWILYESINMLNLMGVGDVSQVTFAEISEICRRYSWSQARSGKGFRGTFSKVTKSTTSGVTRDESRNPLKYFKIDILDTLNLQLDTLQFKKK